MPEGRISLPSEHWNTRSAFQARKSTGKVSVRYGFLYGDSADYVGMAAYYRDFLMSQCGLERVATQGDIPFFVELIGGVSIETPVLGAPIRRTVPLTTSSECQSIIGSLLDAGVANIRLRYSGWLEGGLDSTFPYKAEMDRALGSGEELRRLQQYLAEQGVSLFPDVSLLNSGIDGFDRQKDASRFLDRQVARVYREEISEYDYQRGGKDFRYVVSPGRLEALVDRFLDGYLDYGFEGISLRHMGTQVNSDFHVKSVVDRGEAERIIQNQLLKFTETGLGSWCPEAMRWRFRRPASSSRSRPIRADTSSSTRRCRSIRSLFTGSLTMLVSRSIHRLIPGKHFCGQPRQGLLSTTGGCTGTRRS